jgi:hypothetical protein
MSTSNTSNDLQDNTYAADESGDENQKRALNRSSPKRKQDAKDDSGSDDTQVKQ